MSYFLWVEDFENSPKVTASNVFGSVLNDESFVEDKRNIKKLFADKGIFVELNFQDGLVFIQQELNKKIDFIILDIDLPAYGKDGINNDVLQLLADFENYQPHDDETEDEALRQKACDELKKIAGFYLYTMLVVELGFPKQHILFCSNHGENTKSIQEAFKTAKIVKPEIYEKSHEYVKNWVKSNYENPYSRLRRGIIEGCRYLKALPESSYQFNQFVKNTEKKFNKQAIHDYLDLLIGFLPLQQPTNTPSFYKLLVRTLAHEWEAYEPQKLNGKKEIFAFSWIMKMTRNWSAHSNIFERLSAQDVAYLFIVNMRALFELDDELLQYEQQLLALFDKPINNDDFHEKVGENFNSRKIPLTESYALSLKKTGNTWQAINFHDSLNNLQKNHQADDDFLIRGLYQTFWLLTSNGKVYIPADDEKIKTFSKLNYQFQYFDYRKPNYLFELARHIYIRSFPEA
jgi:hypothetical protein